MPEITRKRTGELLRQLFEILLKHPDGLQAAEALKRLAELVVLSEYEKGTYSSGSRRFEKSLDLPPSIVSKRAGSTNKKVHGISPTLDRRPIKSIETQSPFTEKLCVSIGNGNWPKKT